MKIVDEAAGLGSSHLPGRQTSPRDESTRDQAAATSRRRQPWPTISTISCGRWRYPRRRSPWSLTVDGQIEREPRYGPALAAAAACHNALHVSGWTNDPEANRREGIDLARRALRGAGDDPGTLARAAYVLGYSGEDFDAAIASIDRSLGA
jgi:hypothetical protein